MSVEAALQPWPESTISLCLNHLMLTTTYAQPDMCKVTIFSSFHGAHLYMRIPYPNYLKYSPFGLNNLTFSQNIL